jgi:hypothetical protein
MAAACSLPRPGPGPALPGDRAERQVALADLFASVRVAGLEDRRFSPETWWSLVTPLLGGTVTVESIGESAEGRPLRMLSFGSGPTTVLLWSQMHGDESTASMALADLVRLFSEADRHPVAQAIGRGATVHMIPILNPDGAARFTRRNAQGVDINRDARRLQTPEGRVLRAAVDRLSPDFGFNLHDQSAAVRMEGSDRGVAIALLAPAFNEARDVDDKRHRAMQVASLLIEAMEPMVGDHIAKYDDTFNPRAFGDLVGSWGASTVLIESGAWPDDPQKQHLRATNFTGLVAALDGIASGRYADLTPARYDALSFNGRRLPDLLIAGATVAAPGLPHLRADLLVEYDRPLLRQGGTISDIGDLEDVEAQDTLDLSGLYLIPFGDALDAEGALGVGRPARFLVAEDSAGSSVRLRFDGGPPRAGRRE